MFRGTRKDKSQSDSKVVMYSRRNMRKTSSRLSFRGADLKKTKHVDHLEQTPSYYSLPELSSYQMHSSVTKFVPSVKFVIRRHVPFLEQYIKYVLLLTYINFFLLRMYHACLNKDLTLNIFIAELSFVSSGDSHVKMPMNYQAKKSYPNQKISNQNANEKLGQCRACA